MEHLSLEIFDLDGGGGSKYATLGENTSITITDTSEIFASGDVWSHSFILNIEANAHIFGTAGDMHGSRLHDEIDHRRARLWVEGMPLYLGYLRLDEEAEVDSSGNVDVSFESGQKTFDQMIEGAKANQVPMMSDVLIGLALWRKRKDTCTLKLKVAPVFKQEKKYTHGEFHDMYYMQSGEKKYDITFSADGESDDNSVQQYPRMVFPVLPEGSFTDDVGGRLTSVNCLNTDYAYDDEHPYCNVTLCYQKYGYTRKDSNGNEREDYSSEPEAQRGYEVMPANRVNSAPNFYVIYWIKALMKHLGIHIDENQMMGVEDLRRLFFVNTNCAYVEPEKLRTAATPDPRFGKYHFKQMGQTWRRLVAEYFGEEKQEGNAKVYKREQFINIEESGFPNCTTTIGEPVYDHTYLSPSDIPDVTGVNVVIKEVGKWTYNEKNTYEYDNGFLHEAYADKTCFPDVEISDVIKAIENGFGVRFLFSDGYTRVRIVLLKNIFQDNDVQQIECDIEEDSKVENCIRGFRMTYGNTEDTHFYYKGFQDLLPHKKELWIDESDKHDYSKWKLSAQYAELINNVSAFDKTCYVTDINGNAYGIKVDKDAKRYDELHPSLIEYAGFMDAEDGDCSGEEETIETIEVGFTPAIMNDLNMEEERSATTLDGHVQKFALFVDKKMNPRRPDLNDGQDYNDSDAYYQVYDKNGLYGQYGPGSDVKMTADDGIVMPGLFAIASDIHAVKSGVQSSLQANINTRNPVTGDAVTVPVVWPLQIRLDGHISEGYKLYLQDNFEPNDDGVCPIEKHDWGLTLGIMRGSGNDARIAYKPDPDDHEGNDTWDWETGSSVTAHPDTCDCYGREWDYNGDSSGIGEEDGRVSLKLRAEKLNPYYDPKSDDPEKRKRYLDITSENLRKRGLMDKFYKEYSFWIRNARICKRPVHMELAQLLKIDKTKKVTVGDITGFIRKMEYSIDNKTGLGVVTFELMYI